MATGWADSAWVAPARVRFKIPPEAYAEALLDLAQQANVTLVGAAACSGYARVGLAETLTLDQALDRLLAGAPCSWKEIAPETIQISPLVHPAARPPAPVAVSELLVPATKRVRDPRELAVAVTAVGGSELQA